MAKRKYIETLWLVAAVVIVQLLIKVSGTEYFYTQLTMSAYYSLVIIGLCMLMGYAGQISLGHAGFFAMGGYMAGMLTTHNLLPFKENGMVEILDSIGVLVTRTDLYGAEILHFHPWISCILEVLVTVIVAYLIGGPVLKLKGH